MVAFKTGWISNALAALHGVTGCYCVLPGATASSYAASVATPRRRITPPFAHSPALPHASAVTTRLAP